MKIPEHDALLFSQDVKSVLRFQAAALQNGQPLTITFIPAPTKKHRPIYVEALLSAVYGRRVWLHNRYVWQRWTGECSLEIVREESADVPFALHDVPDERRLTVEILLRQCPTDLVAFVQPVIPPYPQAGLTVQRVTLTLEKRTIRETSDGLSI